MYYSSCNASISAVCSYSIDKHFAIYKIFQAIECLQYLLEHDGLRDANLNFQNGSNASHDEKNHNEPCNNTRWLQNYNETIFFLFQATLLCNRSWVHATSSLKTTWSGELSDNYTANIYVYCNNERRNCGY